ncbi:hypothetical protein DV515_00019435, partial [Chloebia gouldiae]
MGVASPGVGVATFEVGVASPVPSPSSDPYGGSTEENSEDEEGEGEPIPPPARSLAASLDASVTHVVTSQDPDPTLQQ